MSVEVQDQRTTETRLSAAEQTRASWARLIRSGDEVPPAYRGHIAGDPFPYAVLTPTYAGFMRRETERLVYCLADQLIILEKASGEPKRTVFALSDIQRVELGAILLKAWFTVQGRANGEDHLTTLTLRFNAVSDHLFTPFVDVIRGTSDNPIDFPRELELSKLDDFDLPSYKFRNYARRSARPGDRIIAAIGQNEMRRPVIRIGRWAYRRTTATAHVLLLTDHELIVIHDDPDSPPSSDGTRYGGVWHYLPLDKIERIAWRDKDAEVLAVTFDLPLGDRVESMFPAARRVEVERFLQQVGEWAPDAALQRA
jgi:hypothetical protein